MNRAIYASGKNVIHRECREQRQDKTLFLCYCNLKNFKKGTKQAV